MDVRIVKPPSVASHHTTHADLIGLGLALIGPFVVQSIIGRSLEAFVAPVTLVLLGQGCLWLIALGVLAIAVCWEHTPLASLGVRPLTWQMVVVAIALGMVLGVAIPVLEASASRMFASSQGGTIQNASSNAPAWLLLIVVFTASITEEILFRAYPMERLTRLSDSIWLAAALSLAAFVVFHLQGWNIAHIFGSVLPLGAILTALYAWRRNLLFNILVHFVIDLPLVLIAAGVLPPL